MAKSKTTPSPKPSQNGKAQKLKTLSKKEKEALLENKAKELNELSTEDFNTRYSSQIGKKVEELDDRTVLTEELANFELKADLEAKGEKANVIKGKSKSAVNANQVEVTDSDGKTWPIGKPGPNDYVVKQWNETELNGGMVVVPNTTIIQTYNREIYNSMVEADFWAGSQMNYEVLQEPADNEDTEDDE